VSDSLGRAECCHAPTGIKIGSYGATDCDAILGEVKTGLEGYHQVFSVPGTQTSTIDTSPAKAPSPGSMQFTYRIRCKKGAETSGYSNELSAFGPA
jgi:hypothetical protein